MCRDTGDLRPARELLLQNLLDGTPAPTVATTAGVDPATGFLVLLCRPRNGVDWSRCAATVRAALPDALFRADSGELIILLPTLENAAPARVGIADLVLALGRTAGPGMYATQAFAPTPQAVPAAVDEAREALLLVAAMPDVRLRPYQMQELLIELAVARQPAVRQRLADLLTPLGSGKDLTHTLETLFDCGLDRERTTKALHIHRRTLTYRLQRIRELTGINPATAHGIQVLRSALVATRLPVLTDPRHKKP